MSSIPGSHTIGRLLLGEVTVFDGHMTSPRNETSHPGQLSLLPSVGQKMSTGQNAVMRCG